MIELLGALAALALGLYWGLGAPGLRRRRAEGRPTGPLSRGGSRWRVRRHFTPLDLLRRADRPSRRHRGYLR